MSTLVERWREHPWRQARDQALHLLIGLVTAAASLGIHHAGFTGWQIVLGIIASLWVASLREFEQRPVGSWGDLFLDVAVTIVGGAVGGAIFMVTT